jgi:hypothetical protein
MAYCEDAPCCGCCGTNIYGVRQDDGGMSMEDYLSMGDEFWDNDY